MIHGKLCPDAPRCQRVKDAVEIDADSSVFVWIATTTASVGSVDHTADPCLNVGGRERRGAERFAGRLCGWNFAHA